MSVQNKLYFVIAIIGLVALGGCHKLSDGDTGNNNNNSSGNNNTGPVSTVKINPQTTASICDFDVSDTSLTNHGWTKAFDDEFTGDLSNWYVLVGGTQGALQCNEAANVQIVNGALQIAAKHETVTGPKTVNNAT